MKSGDSDMDSRHNGQKKNKRVKEDPQFRVLILPLSMEGLTEFLSIVLLVPGELSEFPKEAGQELNLGTSVQIGGTQTRTSMLVVHGIWHM